MLYNVQCPNCHQEITFDALHSKMDCPTCKTILVIKTTNNETSDLIDDMLQSFKGFQFLKAEQLADEFIHTNPTNVTANVIKAATMMYNEMNFTEQQLKQCFDYFEAAYSLAQDEHERLFVIEQMNSTICTLYLHHLKHVSQNRDLEDLSQLEELYNQIAALQFKEQSLSYLFLLQLGNAHAMIAKELNRYYIRCTNSFHANSTRSHADTTEYVKDLLFFSLIAKFIAKRSEILNQLSTVNLDDALIILYDLIVHRYDEELSLSYFIENEEANSKDYVEVNVELDADTRKKLRNYRESYALLRTKVGLQASG